MTDYGSLYEQNYSQDDDDEDGERDIVIDIEAEGENSLERAMVRVRSSFQQEYSKISGIYNRIKDKDWSSLPDHVKMLFREQADKLMDKISKLTEMKRMIIETMGLQEDYENEEDSGR